MAIVDEPSDIAALEQRIEGTVAILRRVEAEYLPAVLASSFSAEDMVLLDLIRAHTPGIDAFTLDTGRLNAETYKLQQRVRERYGPVVRTYYPEAFEVEQVVASFGVNGFYHSLEARQACCHARKVEPLRRALSGQRAWLTGMRRAQAATRSELPIEEHDPEQGLIKLNPLAEWQEADVWGYLRSHGVPYNKLYDQGYRSIGCAPCTRPVAAGEDIRAGRWWWEHPARRECGLHRSPQD
ncbi:phosphoadenylyl-sulfate reductase [Halorhodospira halophila]|uniref:Adenosine 5'-phosphosulfate reductase n=1 Tax=Halorhodospira halophila (strain DSM 244 / SL1) TaxID=349124 RepID=A1WXX9_HALHL|nr:phosphoadenylyl-sulfate reductase [Halorhodospira halophila]ABM62541.1 phosphoadenylylsulfate reductase (thioredoxin) [Halorhodospira halophila SL1]MBK1728219.1 phosphoadenylyl-sulfate reductase [Halorhodospira halophila]